MHFITANSIISEQNRVDAYHYCSRFGLYPAADEIVAIKNAPELLEQDLRLKKKKCMISLGQSCDPYLQPEEKLYLTRRCLDTIDRYEFGTVIRTKSKRVLRDLDLLTSINEKAKCVVVVPIPSANEKMCSILEPNTPDIKERREILMELQAHGIPAMVQISPVFPYINDSNDNMEGILRICTDAQIKGVICTQMGVTIEERDRKILYRMLDKYFPFMRVRYIKTFGRSKEMNSPNGKELTKLLKSICKQNNIMYRQTQCNSYLKKIPEKYRQMNLFDFLQ